MKRRLVVKISSSRTTYLLSFLLLLVCFLVCGFSSKTSSIDDLQGGYFLIIKFDYSAH